MKRVMTMKRIHTSSKILSALYVVLLFTISTTTGCSYVSDAIEGVLTKRAGFSIDAYYDGDNVIVSWSESGSGNGFAGYEVYMTEEPDNEFADYIVVGARYGISLDDYFNSDSTLEYSHTLTFEHSSHPTTGVYFYRVGIISWEKIDADGDGEKDDYPPDEPDYYISTTSVSQISGSARVEL